MRFPSITDSFCICFEWYYYCNYVDELLVVSVPQKKLNVFSLFRITCTENHSQVEGARGRQRRQVF